MSHKPKQPLPPPSIDSLARLAVLNHADIDGDIILNRVKASIIQAVLDHQAAFVKALRRSLTHHLIPIQHRTEIIEDVERDTTLLR